MIKSDYDDEAKRFYTYYYDKSRFEKGKLSKCFIHNDAKIDVSGDVSFNLWLKDGSLYSLFGSIIKDADYFDNLNDNLEILRYSPMNISLMPKTGELNMTKKGFGNDRFDSFAWLIDLYYCGSKASVINAATRRSGIINRLVLSEFLDSYSDVYDYFKDFYGIDEKLVKSLIKSGKKAIDGEDSFLNYIKLALIFWEERLNHEKIRKYLTKSEIKKYSNAIVAIKRIIASRNE